MRLPRCGISTANRLISRLLSGQPKSVSGTPTFGTLSQCPSIAAILIG